MSAFMGGSAYSMANQIAEGFILMSATTVRKFQVSDVKTLEAELEKLAREVRAENPPLDDTLAVQKRNRKLGRINQAQLILRNHLSSRR